MAAWIAPAIGAVLGGASGFLGQSSANAAARKQASLQNKANKQNWRYQNRQIKNQNKYNQESVEIARENQDLNIQLQEQQAMDNWSYNMTIRDFEYNNQLQAFNRQRLDSQMQLNFNDSAAMLANQKQDNWLAEQMLNFDFMDLEVDTNWANGIVDYELNKQGLDIEQQSKRASNNFAMQKAQIETLKQEGLARSKGQSGRTAGKNIQAAIAEGGLAQAEIAESTYQAGRQYQNSSAKNGQALEKLSDDLEIMQRKIAAGRISAQNADAFARRDIKMQKLSADMAARAKVMMKPSLAPDLPMPPDLDLYKATIQDAFEIEELPEPVRGVASTPSPVLAGISGASSSLVGLAGALAKN